jgi:hypothetical protein
MPRLFSQPSAAIVASGLLLATGLLLSLGNRPVQAQRGSGIVITGAEENKVLKYSLDFGGTVRERERYRLDIPPQDVAVAEVQINFASNFDGDVDPDEVRLEVEEEPVELQDALWDEEFKSLEVVLKEPVPAGKVMTLVLSQARNPKRPGFYRIQLRLLGTEPNPVFRSAGLWIVSIDTQASERL